MPLSKTLSKLARSLGADTKTANLAAREAILVMDEHHRLEARDGQSLCGSRKFLILGHPYTLHDPFIADPILHKLRELKAPLELMTFGDDDFKARDILWCVFHQMYRRLQGLDRRACAGVIQISTFNCGADSIMAERFRRMCRQSGVPYMLLMVDEHAGRAGVDTRLEAFVDSLAWRQAGRAL
jgi:predicted nucleotide-binding protein (sugar kinase/HSP70/actin superfamily)